MYTNYIYEIFEAAYNAITDAQFHQTKVPAFVLNYEQAKWLVLEAGPDTPFRRGVGGPDTIADIPIFYTSPQWSCPSNFVDLRKVGSHGTIVKTPQEDGWIPGMD